MRLLGGRSGEKVLNALPKLPQRSRSLLIINPCGGAVDQLDICRCEAKWLLGEGERGERCASWWRNQDMVVGPVHDDDRASRIQAQLCHVLRGIFLVASRIGIFAQSSRSRADCR